MRLYTIKSPAGTIYRLTADSFFHAIQRAKKLDNFAFNEQLYFNLNK